MVVGLFVIAGFLCFVYMSVQFGEFSIFSLENNYTIQADFENISGLKRGAVIELAGVNIGKVQSIGLNEYDQARVTLQVDSWVKITDDAIASIKTQGIIGDKYVKITQGGSEDFVANGDLISETESAVDIEELVSKYIFGDV